MDLRNWPVDFKLVLDKPEHTKGHLLFHSLQCNIQAKYFTDHYFFVFHSHAIYNTDNNQYSAKTRCVCETQMHPIMANSKDGQGHKDKYLDTSRKILSQEMLTCNMKALALTVPTPRSRSQGKKIMVPKERSYHKEYSCEISNL